MTAIPPSAERVINFVERLTTHVKGPWAGKPFLLPPWQKEILVRAFGPTNGDGTRTVRLTWLEIAKKNGKSELAAALGLYGLLADGEAGAEVVIAATARKQAEKIFKVCAQMVRNSPTLSSLLRVYETTKTIIIRGHPTCTLQAISADANTEDGWNPSFVLFDETHRHKNSDLWDILQMGSDTRAQPMLISLTTAGVESESPLCWEMHCYAEQVRDGIIRDPTFLPIIYAAGDKDDWRDPATWLKANPAATGDYAFKRLDGIKEAFEKALRIPGRESSFRRFQLNQWVSAEETWIPLHEWDKPEMAAPINAYDLEGKECFAGLDLSANQDLTAFVLVFDLGSQVLVLPKFFLPKEGLEERCRRDRVPYDRWAAGGYVELTPGREINHDYVRKVVNDTGKLYLIREIAFDPWNAVQLGQQLEDDGFQMVRFTPSTTNYNTPMKSLERRILGGSIRHGGHPVLRWNLDCTAIKRNSFDQIRPIKPDRGKSRKRIDGIVALAMGLDRLDRHHEIDLDGFLNNPVIIG